jgi:hypothetical protein
VWSDEVGSSSLVGEIAHIVGAKASAARGDDEINGSRDAPGNLILLCRDDHKIVDDNESAYSTERLHAIRSEYLAWLESQLTQAQPWSIRIGQYSYLNVPRLDELAALLGYRIEHESLAGGAHLSSLGYDLNYLMSRFRATLERLPLQAAPADEIQFVNEMYIGQIISFDRLRFRTRNLPTYRPEVGPTKFTGSLERDPHIYHSFPDWRFVISVDPRWITTDTAYGLFRPSGGSSVFSGFARINSVDYEHNVMMATGLAIGLPPSFLDGPTHSPKRDEVNLASLEDDVTKALNRRWSGAVETCQGCGKLFENGDYMVDGPPVRGGPWGNICESCFSSGDRRLGVGYGQLYRKSGDAWLMVGGYPIAESDEGPA